MTKWTKCCDNCEFYRPVYGWCKKWGVEVHNSDKCEEFERREHA